MTDEPVLGQSPHNPDLLPPAPPPSLAERHPIGVGDLHARLAALEVHLKDALFKLEPMHNAFQEHARHRPPPDFSSPQVSTTEQRWVAPHPDIGGDSIDGDPLSD